MKEVFEQLYNGQHLTHEEMTILGEAIFTGGLSEAQVSAALIALKIKGITSTEMAALAQVMQAKALKIENVPLAAMDNCGTGGRFSIFKAFACIT